MLELPRIYPITDRRVSGLTHAEQTRRLIDGGATLVQLREKLLPTGDWYDDAAESAELCRAAGVLLIVNDRVDLTMTLHAGGVHLGQDDLSPCDARKLLGPDAVIGFSTHSLDQLKAALSEPVDYLGFGPIFSTKTKADPDPTVGLGLLKSAVTIAGPMPIVAIGGIREAHLSDVFASGANSAALIGGLLSTPAEIASRYKAFTLLNK